MKSWNMLPKELLDLVVIFLSIIAAVVTYIIVNMFSTGVYSGMLYLLLVVMVSSIILLIASIDEYIQYKKHKYKESNK